MTGADDEAPDDEGLAARAASGDRTAFASLVRRHQEPLYRFIRRYVGAPDDAYDILQDSFISAWLALHRFDTSRPIRPWLRTIALNKCRDFGRRQTVRRAILKVLALGVSVPAFQQSESEDQERKSSARLARLDQAIAELPALYKEPLLLTTVEGLSQDEAAKILKTTRKAVEMRLYRARRRLTADMNDTEAED